MKRVAILTPGLEHGGGNPVTAAFFADALRDHAGLGVEVISLATSARDRYSARLAAPASWLRGPRVGVVPWLGGEARHAGGWAVELEFQRYRPRRVLDDLLAGCDLVHVLGGFPAWALVASRSAAPVVAHCASLSGLERATAVSRARGPIGSWRTAMTRMTERLDERGLRAADRVLVMNERARALVEAVVPAERVALVPPGVDVARFTPPARRAERHLLSVARWTDPRKNVRLLFRAYAELLRSRPDAPPLVLAGAPAPRGDDLAFAASLGIADRLQVRGRVRDDELVGLYQDAALFALASDEEGFGQVLTEAMACGTPVVTTDCGGPSSCVRHEDTGLFVPVGDAVGLARAMERLLADVPLRRALGDAARADMEARFSPARIAARLLSEYERAEDAHAARRRRAAG